MVSGFMLVLTTWILKLVISEANDTGWYNNFLRAYYGAESWIELWLLAYNDSTFNEYMVNPSHDISEIIETNSNLWLPLTYEVNAFSSFVEDATISPWNYHLIKLYWPDWEIREIEYLNSDGWENLKWNILAETKWMYWKWNIDDGSTHRWVVKFLWSWEDLEFEAPEVNSFLTNNDNKVLILFNTSENSDITYSLSTWANKFQTWEAYIKWSAKSQEYKQNLRVKIDTAEWINFLKYSIYSPE